MLEHALLYFIPSQGRDDIVEGYTDYVIWNRFRPESLDIDGEMPMECVDSGIVLLKGDPGSVPGMTTKVEPGITTKVETGMNPTFPIHDVLGKVLNYAYEKDAPGAIPLLW